MATVKILQSSETELWYTDPQYIESVREVLGYIDLDPASDEFGNSVVKAGVYFDEEKNGLTAEWYGKVWMNCPYGKTANKSNQGIWIQKLIHEYTTGNVEEAIAVVNAQTSERWFRPMWEYTLCFTDHRMKFVSRKGGKSQPTHGNVFVYMGQNPDKFCEVFERWGKCIQQEKVAA